MQTQSRIHLTTIRYPFHFPIQYFSIKWLTYQLVTRISWWDSIPPRTNFSCRPHHPPYSPKELWKAPLYSPNSFPPPFYPSHTPIPPLNNLVNKPIFLLLNLMLYCLFLAEPHHMFRKDNILMIAQAVRTVILGSNIGMISYLNLVIWILRGKG